MQQDSTIPAKRIARFWSLVEKTETCWLWRGPQIPQGYGEFCNQKAILAHRFSWQLAHGPIPVGLYILHTCDVPLCVNPDHLWAGTQQDNIRDCLRKRRLKPWGKNLKPPE